MAKIKNLSKFKIICILVSLLYFYLFISLLFFPESLLSDPAAGGSSMFYFLARRASALMIGFSFLLFFARNAAPSVTRQAISFAVAVNMLGFAISSIAGYIQSPVDGTFLFAAVIEILITVIYLVFIISDRRFLKKNKSKISETIS